MEALIFNSALSELFKSETPFIPGTLIYDSEKTDVWHKQKYPSGDAYARAYKYGDYLGKHLDLVFHPDGTGTLFLIEGEKLINKIPVEHLWDVEHEAPDIISLYGVAQLITGFLGLAELVPLPRSELEDLFDRLRTEADRPTHYPRGDKVKYGNVYEGDDGFKYRIVTLPPSHYQGIRGMYGDRLLTQSESLNSGIRQSPGWEHIFSDPKSHSLIYRRST